MAHPKHHPIPKVLPSCAFYGDGGSNLLDVDDDMLYFQPSHHQLSFANELELELKCCVLHWVTAAPIVQTCKQALTRAVDIMIHAGDHVTQFCPIILTY